MSSMMSAPVSGEVGSFTEHRIGPAGHGIYVRDYPGQGTPFVLLHGFPDNGRIYDQLAPLLSRAERRAIVIDFLGFGASDKPDDAEYGFQQQASDVIRAMDGLDVEKAILVGHDAGGPVALNLALDTSDRVAGCGLLNVFYDASPSLKFPELIALFAEPALRSLAMAFLRDPKQLEWLLTIQRDGFAVNMDEDQKAIMNSILMPLVAQNFGQKPSAGFAFARLTGQSRAVVASNTKRLPELERCNIPVKLIWGSDDPYLDSAVAVDLAAHLKNGSLDFVKAGHWPQIERPADVAELLLKD